VKPAEMQLISGPR